VFYFDRHETETERERVRERREGEGGGRKARERSSGSLVVRRVATEIEKARFRSELLRPFRIPNLYRIMRVNESYEVPFYGRPRASRRR